MTKGGEGVCLEKGAIGMGLIQKRRERRRFDLKREGF